jgi:glucose-1-phosphate adenylyltransferase
MRSVLAIILGGGQGTRLFPLTHLRSKPAVPIGGKYRLIDLPISNCLHAGIRRIYVLTQFNSASLNRHIKNTYHFSAFSKAFVDILAAEQTPDNPEWFGGTADAVRQVLPHLHDVNVDNLLILSADHLYRMDYRELLSRHTETNADVTVSAIPCARETASNFGLLKTDANGRVIEFREKPQGGALEEMRVNLKGLGFDSDAAEAKPFLASMGVYVFKYQFLENALRRDPAMLDFGKDVIPLTLKVCHMQTHIFRGYWEDIGSISSFYTANLEMTAPRPKFSFFDAKSPIFTRARNLPPSKLDDCEVRRTIISEGCDIKRSKLHHSVIGLRTYIERGVLIEDSVVMGAEGYQTDEEILADVRSGHPPIGIGEGAIIQRAIIDKNARIGKGVRLINAGRVEHADGPEGHYYIRDGIIVVPKNAVISDGTIV